MITLKSWLEKSFDKLIPKWIIPNHFTILRITGALFILILGLSPIHLDWLVPAGLITGFSDTLDGWLARRRLLVSNLGALLDPIADKIFTVVLLIIIYWRGLSELNILLLIAFTELHVLILPIMIWVHRRRIGSSFLPLPKIQPNYWGKIKTAWLASAIGFTIIGTTIGWYSLKKIGTWNIGIAILIGIIAMINYFIDYSTGYYK